MGAIIHCGCEDKGCKSDMRIEHVKELGTVLIEISGDTRKGGEASIRLDANGVVAAINELKGCLNKMVSSGLGDKE